MSKIDAIIIGFFIVLGLGLIGYAAYGAHELSVKQPHINTPHLVWD